MEFDDHARAQVKLTFDSDVQSIAFGQQGTYLDNLLFVTHDDATNTAPGTVAPTPTELTIVDVTTLQQVQVAQGGTRGFAAFATSDGRLLISQSHEVDVLEPVVPPTVEAVNPPKGSIAALPLGFLSVTFDQAMYAGAATDSSSVTDPANYSLVGDATGKATIASVQYNPSTHTALLLLDGLPGDHYTLTVSNSIVSANRVPMLVPYVTDFTGVSNLASFVKVSFYDARSDRADGTVSFDVSIQNIGAYSLFLPLFLVLDPAQGFTGVPENASESSDGLWLINLNSTLSNGVDLQPGQITTGSTVTITDPNQLKVAYTPDVSGTPASASAPVFDSAPNTSVSAGALYSYQVAAHDPDGSTPGFLLVSGPSGMTVNATTGLLTWATQPTSPATVTVALYAYDPSGSYTQQQFAINVGGGSHDPVISPLPPQVSGQEGQPLVLPVSATDPDGRSLVYWANNLPGGVSFDPTSHTLLWKPDYGQAGTYNDVTFFVSDGVNTVSTSITLLIAPAPPPPQLIAPADQTLREGDHLRFTLRGSDADGSAVSYSSTALPTNATLDPLTGVFDWPVGYDQAGTFTVPFTVTSSSGLTTTQTATYTVLPAPAAPIFNPLQSWQVNEGQPISFTGLAVDPHNPTFQLPTRLPDGSLSPYPTTQPTVTYQVSGLPTGATFDPDTALFSWTPGNTQAGTYNVVFTGTNNGYGGPLSTSITVPITVLVVNHAPVVTPVTDLTIPAGQSFDQAVSAVDPDGNPLTLSVSNGISGYALPGFVTLTDNGNGTGVLHFNPPAGNGGTYTLTLTATDNGDGLGAAGVLTGTTSFIVTVQSPTQLPTLNSVGPRVAIAGQPFTLNLQASESDQDNLTWRVNGLPPAATLTPSSFYGAATLNWTPTSADLGSYSVTFTVTDTGNSTTLPSSVSQTIRLVVRANDTAPAFPTTAPTATVAEGQALSLAVAATKAEGDSLYYSASSLPFGASLDPAFGLLTWTPEPGQAGTYSVTVTATDGSLSSSETVKLTVNHTNYPPIFVPLFPQYAREGTPVQFNVIAADLDGDPVTYTLTNTPAGAIFNAASGVFQWTPSFGSAGDYTLHFVGINPAGLTGSLDVVLHVAHVVRPPLIDTPNHQATLGELLGFSVQATDLDAGTTLTYTALNLPAGATLDPHSGLFQWIPGPSQTGDYVVTLQVSDGQATSTQNILIRSSVQPQTPSVTIALTPSFPAIPGQQVIINVIASSVAPISGVTLTVDGQPVTLDSNGRATITAGAPGQTMLQATATDQDDLVGTATSTLKVRDPQDTTPPVVSFDPTILDATLTGTTAILGTVSDSNLDSWTLEIATPNNPNFTVLATGQTTVNDGALAVLDPSHLTNGFYQLLLTARDISGRTTQTQTQIEIHTATKPNDYVVTDTDLSVAIGGTTINIQRTYDSLTRNGTGDLGYGWQFVNRDTNLQTNVPLTGEEAYGVYNAFRAGTELYLTLPTGACRVRFTFAPTSFQVAGQTFYHPAWQSDTGVTYTLTSTDAVLTASGSHYYDLATGQPYNPDNPFFSGPSYTLTAPDGTRYQLDASGEIIGEVTPNGSQFFLSDSGITSSDGQTIQFLRDDQGRITSIVTPGAQVVTYQYDSAGNLVAMQNQFTGGSQRYGYSASDPHLLIAATRSNGNSLVIQPGTTNTAYIDDDLGGAAQFSGRTVDFDMTAGAVDRFAFRFDQNELNSTATGGVLLRVLVQGTSSGFAPGVPTIAGLTPRSVITQGNQLVALFAIDQPGLYVVTITGASASTAGSYNLTLSVAGDLNADGNVDGNDSALFASAFGSSVGQSNYNPAADLNGDGKVNTADQVILDSNYGFHATTATVPTTPPTRPVFDLNVNSDSAPIGDAKTTSSIVTLVGATDPNVTVTLQQTGAVTKSNPNGLFVFFNVPLIIGDNAFTTLATNAADVTSQYTKIITRTLPSLDLTPPVVSAHLADDTGRSALDNITSDPTVTGSITTTNPLASFQAQLNQSPVTDVSATVSGTTFTITPALLASINGGPLADGKYTLTLVARDSNGNQAAPATVTFILIATPPVPVTPQLLASSDTGISSSDGTTRLTTPTFKVTAPANAIVRLYADGTLVGQATANNGPVFITTTSLSEGTHQMTAAAEDVAGNVSAAAPPVTIQIVVTPPTTPTLALIVADQFPVGQPGQTNLEHVTLIGTTSAGAYVALYRQSDPNTPSLKTQADAKGSFTFSNVALAPGSQSFVVIASDVAGNSTQFTQSITTTASDTSGPVITAALVNDTGGNNVTYDPTIAGVVDDPSGVGTFQAALDNGKMVNVLSLLNGAGFTFTATNLATINGGVALTDGPHSLTLQATDSLGHASGEFTLSFTLNSTRPLPPVNLHLLVANLTGTSQTTTKSRSFTVEMAAAVGTLVTLYQNGTQVGQATTPASGVLDFSIAGPLPDGAYLFTATATSASGLVSPFSAPFTVSVDNVVPTIASFGLDTNFEARPYGQNLTQMQVVRLVGQTLPGATVKLVETGAETTADSSGDFAFYPVNLPNLGVSTFTVLVTDPAGNTNSQAQSFTRIANELGVNLLPPDMTLTTTQSTARVGDTVTLHIQTQTNDGEPLANLILLVNNTPVALSAQGVATLTSLTPGVFTVTVKGFDAEGNEGDATQTITFLTPPNGMAPPVAGFNETVVTPDVTLPTAINGTANTPDLLQYTLQYSVEGQNQWTTFATGTSSVVNGVLGTIDPTMMTNGFYDVRLTVEDTSGQVSTADEVYQVDGQAKLGNFTLSFADLGLPTLGQTITITRTYDSRTKDIVGDFGYGWSLSETNLQVETSAVLGEGFIQTETVIPPRQVSPGGGLGGLGGLGGFGGLPGIGLPPGLSTLPGGVQYSFQNTQNDYVTIYLPDGTAEKFLMGFTGVTYDFDGPPLATTSIFFEAVPGTNTTGTLEAVGDNNVIVSPAQVGPVTFLDPTTGQVYNPTLWKYTTQNGTVYIISASGGIESITDPLGQTLTFTAGGIQSSDGQSVAITRDAQGRITAITDPMGKSITYQYDFYGDLVAVTDRDGNMTRFTYDTDHTLLEVYDPLGRRGTRTDYDSNGRVVDIINAQGNMTTLQNDVADRMQQVTDALGNVTTLVYDQSGNLIQQIDALGGVTSYVYNAANEVVAKTDPLGNTTTFTYDSTGNVLSETDPGGLTTTNVYDTQGNIVKQILPSGAVLLDQYDSNNEITATVDGAGNETTYQYNSSGERTSSTNPLGQTTNYTYDSDGHLQTLVDWQGNETDFIYNADGLQIGHVQWVNGQPQSTASAVDANGDITASIDPNGNMKFFEYDALDSLTGITDSAGNTVTYQYNALGLMTEIDGPDGTPEVQYEYNADKEMTAEINALGQRTSYIYDALGRQIEVINPDGSTTQTVYDADGHVIATIDELGHETQYQYDAAGDKTVEIDALGDVTHLQYTPATVNPDTGGQVDQPTSVTDPLENTIQVAYNVVGQIISTVYADGSSVNSTYDALGRLSTSTDQLGNTTTYQYGTNSNTVVDPLGDTTTSTYQSGNLIAFKDANGNVTQYAYNTLNQVTATTLPLGQTSSQVYDGDGNVVQTTDFDGNTIKYKYDALNRLTEKLFPDGSMVKYTYNAASELTAVTDSNGTTQFQYNDRGWLTLQTNPDGQTIQYTYDLVGDLTSITTSAGTTTYTYDALNRMATVTAPDGGVTAYNYDAAGNLIGTKSPDGVTETRSYNDKNQLVSIKDVGSGGTVLASYVYTLDSAGQVVTETDGDGSKVVYGYDAAGRLVAETDLNSDGSQRTVQYTYDADGNILSKVDSVNGTTTYQYDANNRLVSSNTNGQVTTYTYDADGNLLKQSTDANDFTTYQWNYESQLIAADVTTAGVTTQIQYSYDAFGNQIAETVNGAPTRFLVNTRGGQALGQTLLEYQPNGKPIVSYVYGLGLISQNRSGAQSYYILDRLGSTRALVSPQGIVTDTYTYDAFGQLRNRTGATANRFLFAGQAYDAALGDYYLRARDMNPATGRFLNQDSFSGYQTNPITTNRYIYAGDDPVNHVDPSGHNLLVVGAIGALVFAAIGFGGFALSTFYNAPERPITFLDPVLFIESSVDLLLATEITNDIISKGDGLGAAHDYWFNSTGKPDPASDALVKWTWVETYLEAQNPELSLYTISTPAGDIISASAYGTHRIKIYPQFWGFPFLGSPGQNFLRGVYPPTTSVAPNFTDDNGYTPYINPDFWSQTADLIHELTHDAAGTQDIAGAGLPGSYGPDNAPRFFSPTPTPLRKVRIIIACWWTMRTCKPTPGRPLRAVGIPAALCVDRGRSAFRLVVTEAWSLWQNALGTSTEPFNVSVTVAPLPADELGETIVTSWDALGRPTAGIIVLSPDADGSGWYLDANPGQDNAFAQSPSATAAEAVPGTDAYGHFDLLTTVLHELGHVEGFMPANPGFERYVQTINGSQIFDSPKVTASLVDADQELDPGAYPGDVLSATLALGVRELPSALDVQILHASTLPPPAPPVTVIAAPQLSYSPPATASTPSFSLHITANGLLLDPVVFVQPTWDSVSALTAVPETSLPTISAPPAVVSNPALFGPALLLDPPDNSGTAGSNNGKLIVTDDMYTNAGFNTRGAGVTNDLVNLTDATRFNSGVWRSFVIPAGVDVFQFTITQDELAGNGLLAPGDAFEVALLNTNTMQSLVGTASGLTQTDAFLNIQQTGQVFFGPHVTVSG